MDEKPHSDSLPPHHPMPYARVELAVLSIVENRLCVLLGRRAETPYKGRWGLPGGVIRIDRDLDLDGAAHRIAGERLQTSLPALRQLTTVGGRARDPRSPWALSVVYRALLSLTAFTPNAGKRLEALQWFPVDAGFADVNIAFDHADLVAMAVDALRREVAQMDLPFDYLPTSFTLGELQACCEIILGRHLDKSSFRRRLSDRELVQPIPGAMRSGAFRPAQLFERALPVPQD